MPWRLARQAVKRITWGLADQGMSSITNFAVSIYIARTLGAVQYGAFGLAYVTYSFALNASRGLSTDPLLVRFSGTDVPTWRRAVADCTGTAALTGLITGAGVLMAALALHGSARMAFLALGLTLPALMLQDSWRYSFFALGKGAHAFLNDTIWAATLIPTLVLLKASGHASVFWFVFAWGMGGAVGAAVGPLQARVIPRLFGGWRWIRQHRELGVRYLLEGTANSASTQLRNYGVGIILGLAAVGYVQAATTLMGPFMVIFLGMGLVTLPEAARVLRRSPRHLTLFCLAVSAALSLLEIAWTGSLLVALPRGLGHFALGAIWRPTYPLVLPLAISIFGGCMSAGAGAGLHALGAAKRSLRAMLQASALFLAAGLIGAVTDGAVGTMRGAAFAGCVGALMFWWQLRGALREHPSVPEGNWFWPGRTGRHRNPAAVGSDADGAVAAADGGAAEAELAEVAYAEAMPSADSAVEAVPMRSAPPRAESSRTQRPSPAQPPWAESPRAESSRVEQPRNEPMWADPRVDSPRARPPWEKQPQAEPSRAESRPTQPSRADSERAEPSLAQPSRAESSRPEQHRIEPLWAEPPRLHPTRAESSRAESSRAESSRPESSRAEPPRSEPPRAERPPAARPRAARAPAPWTWDVAFGRVPEEEPHDYTPGPRRLRRPGSLAAAVEQAPRRNPPPDDRRA